MKGPSHLSDRVQSRNRSSGIDGGKNYLAKWIQSFAPDHIHRVHVFGGGLAEFWNWPHDGVSEVVNDLNGELTNFWECLQNVITFKMMQRDLSVMPMSRPVWNEYTKQPRSDAPLDRAIAFFIRYRQSRQGLGKDFATLSRNRTRRGMNEQASSWLTAIDGLPECHDRLKRVVILNDDFRKVLKSQDGPNTLFYCDPPYLGPERTSGGEYGEFEMRKQDHVDLLQQLGVIAGRFILSGYHSELYDDAEVDYSWRCEEKVIDNKASSKKEKPKRTECLWINF